MIFRIVLLSSLALLGLALQTAQGQTLVASDNAESYTNGFVNQVGGTGFGGGFLSANLGDGGTFTVTGERRISGAQSFGVFSSSTGGAIARALPERTGLTRLSMRVRFDLNTNATRFAGIALNAGLATAGGEWNPSQRLFVGTSGDGQWIASHSVGENTSLNFEMVGGDIYHVLIDFNPGTTGPLAGRYRVQIVNETSGTRSALHEGTLGGTAGSSINSFGIANGVVGNEQNLIVDDIAVWTPATLTLAGPVGTVAAGSEVTLQAQTQGVTELFGASLQLGYDPTVVTSTSAASGTLVTTPLFLQQAATNRLDFSVTSRRPASNIAQDGLFATVNATLATGLTPGAVITPFQVVGFSAVNAAGEAIAMVPVVGTLTIAGGEPPPAPAITVSPTSLAFGTVNIGQSPTLTVKVKNTGTASLVISAASVTGPEFSVQPGTATVDAADSTEFTVTFTPTAVGDFTDALVLTTNVSGQETVNVALSGSGQTPPPVLPVVWPGDTDNNGTVEEADLLPIGTHYGRTGASRPGGVLWQGRTVTAWDPETATYADVNGDGVVNVMDVPGIGVNFGLTRNGGSGKTDVAEPIATLRIRPLPVGSRFTVAVSRAEATALMGASARLDADASLAAIGMEGAELFSPQGLTFSLNDGPTLHAAYTRIRGEAPLELSGAMMHVTFEVVSPITGSAEVRLTRIATADAEGNAVPGTFTLDSQVALSAEFGEGLPTALTLDGNAPNPATSRTLLRVGVPETAATVLSVYDTLGREVHRETFGALSAGWHLLPLDVSRLAPGLYLWRVETESYSQSRSLTVVR